MVRTDQTQKTTESVIAWIVTVLTAGYMLPWAIAATRGKSNSIVIGVINFLLGWTIVGWIVALVMSFGKHNVIQDGSPQQAAQPYAQQSTAPVAPAAQTPPPADVPAGWYPDPQGSGQQRYWDGAAWTTHTAPPA